MFTVVILEQEHLESIRQYRDFLAPFLKNDQIALCRWRPEGQTLLETVPELHDCVARQERWRAVVICDETGIGQSNPFDRVDHCDPVRPEDMSREDYLALRRQARLDSYGKAAREPLVRLMTWLCQAPMTDGDGDIASDPEFGEYLAQSQAKAAIRRQLLGDYVPQVELPEEVICVARRCCDRELHDIRVAWDQKDELQYSRFYDYNLYFDKMRYLLFDVLPKSHCNYTFGYIRFLYAMMVLAANEVPMGALRANRVYVMDCLNDEEALRRFLGSYDAKLEATRLAIGAKIRKLRATEKPRLSDRDAEVIFCSNMTVPVNTVQEFDTSELFVRPDALGLATDCPTSERRMWMAGYDGSRKALNKYLKLPRRALRRTVSDLRRMEQVDLSVADGLNVYQLEDVEEYVAREEMKMVDLKLTDLYDTERYDKDLSAQDKRVHTIIERRMTRKWTLILGGASLGLYLTGFLPMFLSNFRATNGSLFSLLFLLGGGILMAATALIALFGMRVPVRMGFSNYNGIMDGIVDEVEGSLTQYSRYLSHVCNVRRGHSVLNYRRDTADPDTMAIRILKKHEMDVICAREEFHDVFGAFLPKEKPETDGVKPYDYDFSRPRDMEYPMPYSEAQRTRISFLQKGNEVDVPVDFIRSMTIRREELHDRTADQPC